MMFGPAYHGRDSTARIRATRADDVAGRAREEARALKFEVERLLMITEALWSFLREEHGWTDDMLAERMREIDMRDGAEDGRVAASRPRHCPECGKVAGKKRPFCMWCGHPVEMDPFER